MAGLIRVTPDELERVAAEYRKAGGDIEGILGHIDGLMVNLDGVWDGEAKGAFFEQYDELKEPFRRMHELMEEIHLQLDSTANALRGADADIASQIRR
ncbi:WXG100 family type VII secretion target [Cerasibacillus terrae]|uniref:ESAT-6-like protein n=1 Tax=Cerasibacillus terrae TaxID=2498845 RepID=A0A5C8NZJ6_9BACI|nr:WXG100 family type VII secretion target [Cerasibacillus terrae]TXL66739.1 WXG100 family type VII secretion target [Cerasibacillus terrae]